MKKLSHLLLTFKEMLRGTLTYIVPSITHKRMGGGSSHSARYCYSVFMRHFVLLKESGLKDFPKIVAEIGPGESIGVGLAALIAGAKKYYGFDVVAYSIPEREQKVFEELVTLFANETPIPDEKEFPAVKPTLQSYDFPYHIFSKKYLKSILDSKRIDKLRKALNGKKEDLEKIISYKAPWVQENITAKNSVDWIFSQAVMEHVEDLNEAYNSMSIWLKKDGVMSHQIDFKCHGLSPVWNGHWAFSLPIWKIIKGKTPYLLNRKVYSEHLLFLTKYHFKTLFEQFSKNKTGFEKSFLAKEYQKFSKDDLETAGAFIISKKD